MSIKSITYFWIRMLFGGMFCCWVLRVLHILWILDSSWIFSLLLWVVFSLTWWCPWKVLIWGALVAQSIEHWTLVLAQVILSGLWNEAPCHVTQGRGGGCLLQILFLPLLSPSLSKINKIFLKSFSFDEVQLLFLILLPYLRILYKYKVTKIHPHFLSFMLYLWPILNYFLYVTWGRISVSVSFTWMTTRWSQDPAWWRDPFPTEGVGSAVKTLMDDEARVWWIPSRRSVLLQLHMASTARFTVVSSGMSKCESSSCVL